MKRWKALLTAVFLICTLCACMAKSGPEAKQTQEPVPEVPDKQLVGLCLPEEAAWSADAQLLTQELEKLGYETRVCYAQNSSAQQRSQLEELIQTPADCLVIVAVDSASLLETQQQAEKAGIPVIAYDRLLMYTATADGYISFDYQGIGAAIGQHVADQFFLEAAAAEERSYSVEFFMGTAEDHSALLLHRGVLSVLQPYLDSGVLVCHTGRVGFEDTYILRAEAQQAQERCAAYLSNYYTPEEPLNICITASDALAQGCIAALTEAGYTGENWPVVTGCGATAEALQAIADGKQSMTVWKDTQTQAAACAEAVHALLQGNTPAFNDTKTGENYAVIVPAYICKSAVVDAENYQDYLSPSNQEE